MPVVGSFGGKRFKTCRSYVYTISHGLSMEMGLSIEEQEKENDKPSTYIKGENLKKIKLPIKLFKQKSVDVMKEINSWESVMKSKKAYPLVMNAKKVGKYNYLLTKVSVSDMMIGANGEILKAKVDLELAEYVRKGKKKKEGAK